MPQRAKSICRKIGCNELIGAPGYCDRHVIEGKPFRYQNSKKTVATKRFYSSGAWTKKSKQHRKNQPLCQECLRAGTVKTGNLVHHSPELTELLLRGLNPLDSKYLDTLCSNCHLKHLRGKKN